MPPNKSLEMYYYRTLMGPRDRFKALSLNPREIKLFNAPRRRYWLIFTVFLLLTIVLSIKPSRRHLEANLFGIKKHSEVESVPGMYYAAKDLWEPPPNWDPVYPVYTNFTSIEEGYHSSTRNLSKPSWLGSSSERVYNPYPDYESEEYRRRYVGTFVPCMGPRGVRLNESTDDEVYASPGYPKDFPEPLFGSSKVIGFDEKNCFDRYGRFGAYGLGGDGRSKSRSPSEVDWNTVNWGALQNQCVEDNKDRFNMNPRVMPDDSNYVEPQPDDYYYDATPKSRTAVLFRAFQGFKFTSDALRNIRSIIMEMALQSGGEYQAFFLVQIKDKDTKIFEDPEEYERVKAEQVPEEFRNMTILWSELLWGKLYPKLPEKARIVHVSQWLPVQYFAQQYPYFDFFWNWEMDVRYTGHHYQFSEQLASFAKQQPRKGLWERNSRFYIPKFHGNYETQFRDWIQSKYEMRDKEGRVTNDFSIWGPNPPKGQAPAFFDSTPPLNTPTPVNENYMWGIGEEADLITMLPMFNPDTTHYALRNIFYNYPKSLNPGGPPRRATIITLYRLSHRLLSTMHLENVHDPGHHMSAETWPQGVSLHHGFKAVYAPHSIWFDKEWPAQAANFIYNNGDQRRVIGNFKDLPNQGEGSGGWESPFGHDREHNFDGSTWYFRNELSIKLYKRLLGYEIEGVGGKDWEDKHGRYCLPPMLFHPIKEMEDPWIAAAQEKAAAELTEKGKAEEESHKMKEQSQADAIASKLSAVTDAANEENGHPV